MLGFYEGSWVRFLRQMFGIWLFLVAFKPNLAQRLPVSPRPTLEKYKREIASYLISRSSVLFVVALGTFLTRYVVNIRSTYGELVSPRISQYVVYQSLGLFDRSWKILDCALLGVYYVSPVVVLPIFNRTSISLSCSSGLSLDFPLYQMQTFCF